MLVDHKKLKNNNDYENLINEINSYKKSNAELENNEFGKYRKKIFKNSYIIDNENLKAVVMPNNTTTPYRTSDGNIDFSKEFNDYTIIFFYKGVEIGHYSRYLKTLSFDELLECSDIVEYNLNSMLGIIPDKKFEIKYNLYFIDNNDRPFYTIINPFV